MNVIEAIKILEDYNEWRRGSDITPPKVKDIGIAIDVAIEGLKNKYLHPTTDENNSSIDRYKNISGFSNYQMLLKSGMFWEIHPELSGNWDLDKEIILGNYENQKS